MFQVKLPRLNVEHDGSNHIGRHQIRRELNPLKLEVKDLSDRPHQQRLCQTRCPCDQTVPARKQTDQKLFDNVTVSGSVGETSQGTLNKSVTAGFKKSW